MPSVGGSIDRFILYGYTVFLEKQEECDGLASVEEHMDLSFVIPRRSLLLFLEQVAILQNATPEEAKRNAEAVVTVRKMAIQVSKLICIKSQLNFP